jgi:uncharacterized membrane protein
MPDIDISVGDWIAVAALTLSIVHIVGRVVWGVIRGRKASFEVSVRKVPVQSGVQESEEQVVIRNHGPAPATAVDVALHGPDGEALEVVFMRGVQIKRVWPGQTLHLPVDRLFGTQIAEVRVCWNDKRRRRQGEHFDVVTHWTT